MRAPMFFTEKVPPSANRIAIALEIADKIPDGFPSESNIYLLLILFEPKMRLRWPQVGTPDRRQPPWKS